MEILKEAIAKCGEDASESDWFGMQTSKAWLLPHASVSGDRVEEAEGKEEAMLSIHESVSPAHTPLSEASERFERPDGRRVPLFPPHKLRCFTAS